MVYNEKNIGKRGKTMNYNEIIKILRVNNGLTQQQMSEYLDVDRSSFSHYEKGDVKPDVYTLMKLARIFNVSMDDMVGFNDLNNSGKKTLADDVDGAVVKFSDLNADEIELLLTFRASDKKSAILNYAKKHK